ncbi:MAG TPA: ABC transporter substrate-binding protein [Candidatus Limnocylindrales bacterium]|nr:ABC transporter substrate-binding protein [Candidatus Limnocylindrales bacterium]
MRARFLAFVLIVVACAPSGVGPSALSASPTATQRPIEAITFIAGFKPQADLPFVGVYVAQERGYFKAQGLDVSIQHAVSGEHVQLVATGRAQFSTGTGGDILKRVSQADVPLVSIAVIGQRDDQAFAVRADSPIRTLKDWEGKLVGYKSTPSADYLALLKIGGVDRSKVREVAVGFDPRVLATGQVDVYPVFAANEPDTLARQGIAVRLFDPTTYGVPAFGLTYMTSREMVASRPDVVKRFLKAALKGIEDAIADRDGAIEIVMKYAPGEDRAHQRYMLDTEIEAALTDATRARGIGAMTKEQWSALESFLAEYGALPKRVDVATVYNDAFVSDLYKSGKLVWP